MIQTTNFRSTAIARAEYDGDAQQLTVVFAKGGQETIRGVNPAEFRAFSEADSAGQFYNQNLKNRR